MELLAALYAVSVNYTGGEYPQSLSSHMVSEDFLEILGAEPALGRGITAEDLDPDADAVVVLTHGLWQQAFGADPDILGRTMMLDGVSHAVVGVLPRDWTPLSDPGPEVILPLRPQPFWYQARGSHFLYGFGRLGGGVTLEQAQADFSGIAAALEEEYPRTNSGWTVTLLPLEEDILGSTPSQLLIFMASVALVLLIACANLANMILARSTVRTHELAIRTAVGAGRGRVVRQLLAESLLLACAGGALGVGFAYGALRTFVARWPTMLPRMQQIEVNATVLLFSLGLSLAAGVVFGLVPALWVSGRSPGNALRSGSRGIASDRSRRWMRATLVVAEVGLAVILLVGSGLLVRSFAALQSENPGFRRDGRLVFTTPLDRTRYPSPEQRVAFGDKALELLGALPGADSVALASLIPLGGSDNIWGYWVEGLPVVEGQDDGSVLFYRISPGYFEAMGIPLLAGRGIAAEDRQDRPPVVVISNSLAEQHFPNESPVGRRIRFSSNQDDPWVEIVGVVGDVQHYSLGSTSIPQVYVPFTQRPTGFVNIVIKASIPPLDLVAGVRDAIAAIDPDQPVTGIEAAENMVAETISLPRFRTTLMAGFGLTALLLAVVGLYGVLAYSVSLRTREIGVRMALGATRGSVLRLVFREGAPLVGIGLVAGWLGAVGLSRFLESMLFDVGALDPVVFAIVPAVLAVVAVAAMLIPARRATRVDPIRTLGEA
jgi:putative ABC transport system permease protein